MSNASDFIIEYGFHKKRTDPEDFPGVPYGILKEYHGPGGDVVVPDGVTAINNSVFQNNTAIKTVFLPDGLRYIYRSVFQNCTNLVSVRIPESVWFIDDSAFEVCNALEEVALPKTMNQLGNAVFRNCSSLKKITVPGKFDRIGFDTFSGLTKLEEMVIPCDPMDADQIKFLAANLLWPDELRELFMKGAIKTCVPLEKAMLKRINTAQYRKKSMGLFLGKKDAESVAAFLKLIPNMSAEELDGYIQAAKNLAEIQALILNYKNNLYPATNPSAAESSKNSSKSAYKVTKAGVLKSWEGNPRVVVIPEGVVEIGKNVFYGCDNLTKVVIPEGVKTIGECAFFECTKLKEVVLPNSLEVIGGGAFGLCPLTNLSIPEGVATIGGGAFCNSKLQKIVIPKSVKSIGGRAFNVHSGLANVSSITNVTILADEITLGGAVFSGGFRLKLYAPNAPLSLFSAEYKRQIIFTYLTSEMEYPPERVEEYNKYIDKTDDFIGLLIKDNRVAALSRLLQIKSKVNHEKFDEFLALTEKNPEMKAALLDYQAKMVQPQAKEKAEKRKTDIALGEKTRTVTEWKKLFGFEKRDDGLVITAYKGHEDIVEVPEKIGKDTVVAIGDHAFSPFVPRAQNKDARRNLRQVILPETIREIEKNAFYHCYRMDYVVIPSSIEKIGDRAFASCENLSNVVIPKGVKTIERFFTDCINLKHVVISEGVKGIGSVAFSGCTALEEISIPNSVTSIDCGAFYRCPNVTIHAPAGSYAERYAKENHIPFVAE